MVYIRDLQGTLTQEQLYQQMHERVATFTDNLGMPVDPGIFETVVALNLLGLHTFQSCEGHLDHGCPYPWVTVIDNERERLFNRAWLHVCELEERARAVGTVDAYDDYLSADVQLRILIAGWEAQDRVFEWITGLLDAFYADRESQANPARLLVRRFRPGIYRIEPGFVPAMKELPNDLKAVYLERGQAEMQAFTVALKQLWQEGASGATIG